VVLAKVSFPETTSYTEPFSSVHFPSNLLLSRLPWRRKGLRRRWSRWSLLVEEVPSPPSLAVTAGGLAPGMPLDILFLQTFSRVNVEAICFLFACVINQITLWLKRRVKLQSQTLFVTISLLERMRDREPHISLLTFLTLDYVPVYGIIYCTALRVSISTTYCIRVAHFPHFLNTLL
jgi:hypothetical protein